MKRRIILVLIVLLLATMACSINFDAPDVRIKTGPTETFTIKEAAPTGTDVVQVELAMGAGTLELRGGAADLINGTVRYNVAGWEPIVTRSGNEIAVKQEHVEVRGIPGGNLINEWKLQLSNTVPLDLRIEAGAYEGTMDLSGMSLRNLNISDGASKSEVRFNSPNPERMDTLAYKTGASQVSLFNLANANFSEMTFDSGAGNYLLDFGGTLQDDATVEIKSGVSAVTIQVPEGMVVRLDHDGALNNIETEGDWQRQGSNYETQGSGSTLTIHVEMGVGSLKLVQK